MMNKILYNRILAAIIDYGIIAGYALLLFFTTTIFLSTTSIDTRTNPLIGQFINLITLTLPVVAYAYFTEKSAWKGTVGKRYRKLKVVTAQNTSNKSILVRNLLKYLPWELAHTGVHWSVYFSSNNVETPIWAWIFLVVPQFIAIVYCISIVLSKGHSSTYDHISNTRIAPWD